MKDMHCYDNNAVTITEENYKKLLKYKDSYNALIQDIAMFYDIDSKGNIIGVDAYALADHLEVLINKIVNRR